MKAIVIRQPYANAISRGEKTAEFRSWATSYRGPLLVVAGLNRTESGTEGPYGVAVCTVELVRCERMPSGMFAWHLVKPTRLVPFRVRGKLGLFEVSLPRCSHCGEQGCRGECSLPASELTYR